MRQSTGGGSLLALPGCTIDPRALSVVHDGGARERLTSGEGALIAFLAARPGEDVTRETLLREVFGYAPGVTSRAVDATVKRLRRKLGDTGGFGLQTVHGTGYRWVPFDAAAETPAAPRALPVERGALFGRDAERAEVEAALRPGALVSLVGPGGVGKTRLAVHVAHRAAGAARFCDLSDATSPAELFATVAAALDLPPDADADRIGRALGRAGGLLVLDNLEQVVTDAAAAIGRWVDGAPTAAILCTSREPLGLRAEIVVRLPPLEPDAAVALFRARAARAGDDGLIREVVARLDGLPLAIELAAARLGAASLAQLRDRLDEPLRVLRDPGRDRPERHAALWNTIAWSWALLPPWGAAALRQLAAFRGRFTLEEAEVVLDLGPSAPWALDVLEELERRSLVHADVPAFWLLSGVRAFAAAQGDDAGALARHAGAVRATGERAVRDLDGAGAAAASATLGRIGADLLAAFDRRADARDAGQAVALARVLDRALYLRGPWSARDRVLDRALALASGADRAGLLRARADARRVRGHLDAAATDLGAALDLATTGTDRSDALRGRSKLLRDLGDMEGAWRDASDALAAAPDPERAALAHVERAASALGALSGEAVLGPIREALAANRAVGLRRGEGLCLAYQGIALAALDRQTEAAECFAGALAVFADLARGPGRRQVLAELARLRFDRGQLAGADAVLRFAVGWFKNHGDDELAGLCALQLGLVAWLRGRPDADRWLAQAEARLAADAGLLAVVRAQRAAVAAATDPDTAASALLALSAPTPLARAMAALAWAEVDRGRLTGDARDAAIAGRVAEARAVAGPLDAQHPALRLALLRHP